MEAVAGSQGDCQHLFVSALLVVAVSVVGCSGQQQRSNELASQEEQALVDTVTALTDEVGSRFNQLETESYLKYFSDDFVAYVRGARVARSEWQKELRHLMDTLQAMSSKLTSRDVEVLGPDAAVVSQQEMAEGVLVSGDSVQNTVAETFIWERRGGEWKIVQHHESFVPPEEGS